MLLFIICEAPIKILFIFRPFWPIFTLFHLKNWPYLQKPKLGNLGETRLLLVINSLCSIPQSGAWSEILKNAGDRWGVCVGGAGDVPAARCLLDAGVAGGASGRVWGLDPARGHTALPRCGDQ